MKKNLCLLTFLVLLICSGLFLAHKSKTIKNNQSALGLIDRIANPIIPFIDSTTSANTVFEGNIIFNDDFSVNGYFLGKTVTESSDKLIADYTKSSEGIKVIINNKLVEGLVLYCIDIAPSDSILAGESRFMTDYGMLSSFYGVPQEITMNYQPPLNIHFRWDKEDRYCLMGVTSRDNIYYIAVFSGNVIFN